MRFDNTGDAAKDAATTVLENTIKIPPTLYRNQGGRVGIYVARDLDFSSVYELRPVRR
ncbi:Type IV secretion system protein virB10 [compost metagenome]